MRGDAVVTGTRLGDQLSRAGVHDAARGRTDVGGDGRPQQRVGEGGGVGPAQDGGVDESVGRRGGGRQVEVGQRRRLPQRSAVAQHRDRARERRRVVREPPDPRDDRSQDRVRGDLVDPRGVRRGRREVAGADFAEQLAQHERVASGDPRARRREGVVAARQVGVDQVRDSAGTQRRGREHAREAVRAELADGCVDARLRGPQPDDHGDRKLLESLREIDQEARGRRVDPLQVVDEYQQAAGVVGRVRRQPVEAVDQPESRVVADLARRVEQRVRQPGRSAQKALAIAAGEQRLEELECAAEGELALDLGAAGHGDRDPGVGGHGTGGGEQRGLPDPGRSLDDDQAAGAGARGLDRAVQDGQLDLPLEQHATAPHSASLAVRGENFVRSDPYVGWMPPRTSIYVCSSCGVESAKWHGRCPDCGEWNTFVEERVAPGPGRFVEVRAARVEGADADRAGRRRGAARRSG